MKYVVSYNQPNNHYIDIELIIEDVNSEFLELQLPAWRPGRYELGNFAKNIQKWEAQDNQGNKLPSKKLTKDLWEVETKGSKTVHIIYNYYAAEINAGSSFLDSTQLYINGVNLFLYVPDRMNEPCELNLKIPSDYKIATGMKQTSTNIFLTQNFDELVDCPLIASNSLKQHSYTESGVLFHLWFQGECKPDFKKLETDFRKFTKHQIEAFGGFPVDEYHFLFQILTYRTYHGVEHSNSTVVSLGPSYDVMKADGWYDELLGVSSHELYHTWNVKQIRPIEMFPYDFSKENYTNLGYLDEGVTTYMGDKFLYISDVFSWDQYAKTFNQLLERHFNNFGVNNYSVAESSFDTWLDGYVKGAPGRKGSIYTEGALIAFMTDIFILRNTKNQRSLHDVMTTLYNDFALIKKGVSESDYKATIETIAKNSYDNIFDDYIHGNKDYTDRLKEALNYIGCNLEITDSPSYYESSLGIKVNYTNGSCIVENIYPESPAEKAGLGIGDTIVSINNINVNNDFNEWCNYFKNDNINLTAKKHLGTNCTISFSKNLKPDCFKQYKVTRKEENNQNFMAWKK